MRNAERSTISRSLNFFDRANDSVEVRPIAGIEFGMEEFAIGSNFKRAAARRDERERRDALAEFNNFGRQTDGLGRVVSDDAVFDGHFGLHLELLSESMVRKRRERVKRATSPVAAWLKFEE